MRVSFIALDSPAFSTDMHYEVYPQHYPACVTREVPNAVSQG